MPTDLPAAPSGTIPTAIARKQRADADAFVRARETIRETIPKAYITALVGRTARAIRQTASARGWTRLGYGWSGGKDSQALRLVCEAAGAAMKRPPSPVLVVADPSLEYPAFLRWLRGPVRPEGLTVLSVGPDLTWLGAHEDWLFPDSAGASSRWFKRVQHRGQKRYYRERDLDALLVGRRRADGNYVSRSKSDPPYYTNAAGVTRYSPLANWTHEEVIAALVYYDLAWAPWYSWPRGFVIGSGPWAKLRREDGATTADALHNTWAVVAAIDPSIPRRAAPFLRSARAFLESEDSPPTGDCPDPR